MQVLLLSSKFYPEYSGSGYRAQNTYLRLEKKYNIKFDVLCNSNQTNGNKKYIHRGIVIYRIKSPFNKPKKTSLFYYFIQIIEFLWQALYTIFFLIKNHSKYNLLHTFGDTWSIGIATMYFSIFNKPIIRELCNDTNYPMFPVQIHSSIAKVFKKNNTVIVAISKKLSITAKKFNPHKVWLRNNPVDETKFSIDYDRKFNLRSYLTPFNKDDKVLSILANIIPNKNQLFCLEILNKLPNEYKLIIAGPLKEENHFYFNKLLKFIQKNNLNERVLIHSKFIPNFEDYLRLSDVFLFPSISEGLGTPILESQALGVPVISSLIEGVTDQIIIDGIGGYTLKLDSIIWVKYIQEAIKIDQKVLIENSKQILKYSGSKQIDKNYIYIINKLNGIQNRGK